MLTWFPKSLGELKQLIIDIWNPSIKRLQSDKQENVQYQDEGVDLGSPGDVKTIDFIGANISASYSSNSLTVSAIPGFLSAGTTNYALGTGIFSNSNGISFGLSSNVITASHNAITSQTNEAVSGSNGSFTFNTLTFGNLNGLSFYTSNGSMVGSYTVPAGGAPNFSAGTTSNNLNSIVFSNSNGLSFGLDGSTITGSYTVPTVTNSSFSVQDSATTLNPVARIAFSTGNNITLSLSTGVSSVTVGIQHNLAGTSTGFAGNSISGSMTHNSSGLNISLNHPAWLTTAAQSNQVVNSLNGSTGQISLNVGSSLSSSTNGSSITFGLASNITTALQSAGAYLTTARASNDAVGLNIAATNVTWTVNSSGISFNASGYAGTGTSATNASVTLNSNGLAISVAAPGAGGSINFSAGTTSNNLTQLSFANSNGVSFGLNGGTLTATVATNYLTTARASNDGIGLNTAQTNVTWTVNSSGLSLNAAGYAGTGTSATNASVTLNSNGLAISVANPGGGAIMQGQYTNIPFRFGVVTLPYIQSTSHVAPFIVPVDLSFDYIRFEASVAISAASTTAATTGNTAFSCGYTKTHNISIFSMGTGANFNTLQLYTSTQFLEYFSNQISCATNSTQFSYSNRWTLPCSSGDYGFTYDYSSSAASINVNSAGVTALTGTKLIEIPFGTSLAAGKYWIAYGASTTTATQVAGTTIGIRNAIPYNLAYHTEGNYSVGTFGATTSNIYGPHIALGSFTTVGGATTNSFHWSKVTVSAGHPILSFNLLRSA